MGYGGAGPACVAIDPCRHPLETPTVTGTVLALVVRPARSSRSGALGTQRTTASERRRSEEEEEEEEEEVRA